MAARLIDPLPVGLVAERCCTAAGNGVNPSGVSTPISDPARRETGLGAGRLMIIAVPSG